MSMLGRSESRDPSQQLPQGELLGNYRTYLDAQKVVDFLADEEFPVQHVSIIGNDLKSVERVTGKLSYPRVALTGAATGAWFGLFVGLLLMLFGGGQTFGLVLSSMAMGAAFWILFSVISYAFTRGKRDFTSTNQIIATSYDVVVTGDMIFEARRVASQLSMPGHALHPGAEQGHYVHPEQPQQQQPQQQQPQQQPQRPAQWGQDPYASGSTEQEQGRQQPPAGPETEPGAPVRGRVPDLPDGRPQYGVRLPPEQEQQPGQPGAPAADPEQGRREGDERR